MRLALRLPRSDVAATPDVRKAVLIMLAGLALFSILNGMVKDEVTLFPVNQVTFFRNALGLPPLLAILLAGGGLGSLRTRHPWRHISHGTTMTCSLLLAFTSFRLMPLADATAISFLRPLLVAALAPLVLREAVARSTWLAIGIGLAGILVIAQPTGDVSRLGVLCAVVAALIGALNLLQQRRLSLTDATLSIVFWYMAISSLMLLPTLFVWWVPPSRMQLLGLVTMGLASGLCQYITIRPFRYAGAAVLAPIQYTGMLWSILIGLLWFAEVPTTPVLLGSAVVIGATLLVMRPHRAPR